MYHKLKDFKFDGKRVVVRVDFNVPVDDNGDVTDSKRIAQAMPTIKYLLEHNAKVILMTHMGRPDGKMNEKYRLTKIGEEFQKLIGKKINILKDCIGDETKQKVFSMNSQDIILLENLRFYTEEEKNDESFAKKLADLGEVYVNDAFGTCHRAHASVHAITKFLPSCAGFLLEKEIEILGQAMNNPQRPFVAILGGAKVSDKIGVIDNLMKNADEILIGGAMANTFLKAAGHKMGASKIEKDKIDVALEIYSKAPMKKVNYTCGEIKKIVLPWDVVCAKNLDSSETKTFLVKNFAESIPDDMCAYDLGPDTINIFKKILSGAKTIIWNGPLGVFEKEKYNEATRQLAEFISGLNATTIIGGGDSAAAIEKYDFSKKLTHISTGGGASLEFIEGKKLPAIAALEENFELFR